jgi:hypothetical protein
MNLEALSHDREYGIKLVNNQDTLDRLGEITAILGTIVERWDPVCGLVYRESACGAC